MSQEQTDCRGTKFITPTDDAPTPGTVVKVPNGDGTYSGGVWMGEVIKNKP